MRFDLDRCNAARFRRLFSVLPPLLPVLAAVTLVGCMYDNGRTPHARDVVVVVVDALRADRVAALGAAGARSPAIDAFVRDGVVYARATAPATWCLPAYGSLLTGRWPSYHGGEHLGDGDRSHVRELDDDATTLG